MADRRDVRRAVEVPDCRGRDAGGVRPHAWSSCRTSGGTGCGSGTTRRSQTADRSRSPRSSLTRLAVKPTVVPPRRATSMPTVLYFSPFTGYTNIYCPVARRGPAAAGGEGRAHGAVRVVSLLRVAARRIARGRRRVQQQVSRSRCAVLLEHPEGQGGGPLPVSPARLDSLAGLGARTAGAWCSRVSPCRDTRICTACGSPTGGSSGSPRTAIRTSTPPSVPTGAPSCSPPTAPRTARRARAICSGWTWRTGAIDYLTYGDWHDDQPRWSAATGRIYFSSRPGRHLPDLLGGLDRHRPARDRSLNGAFDPQWIDDEHGLVFGGLRESELRCLHVSAERRFDAATIQLASERAPATWDWTELQNPDYARADATPYGRRYTLDFAAGSAVVGARPRQRRRGRFRCSATC